jgi:hypothetical protein
VCVTSSIGDLSVWETASCFSDETVSSDISGLKWNEEDFKVTKLIYAEVFSGDQTCQRLVKIQRFRDLCLVITVVMVN